VLNRDHLGHYNSSSNSQIVQSFMVDNNGIYSTPLFWQNTLYVVANQGPVRAFRFSTVTDQFETRPFSHPASRITILEPHPFFLPPEPKTQFSGSSIQRNQVYSMPMTR
jgi:hypothetical protein